MNKKDQTKHYGYTKQKINMLNVKVNETDLIVMQYHAMQANKKLLPNTCSQAQK